jgi:hemerythrin-like metal-binding protein
MDSFVHYRTNVVEVDSQHKELFLLLETLRVAIANKCRDTAYHTFELFIRLAMENCAIEEKMMVEVNYPFTPGHKRSHTELANVLRNCYVDEHATKDVMYLDVSGVISILKHHIDWYDIPLGEYYNQKRGN